MKNDEQSVNLEKICRRLFVLWVGLLVLSELLFLLLFPLLDLMPVTEMEIHYWKLLRVWQILSIGWLWIMSSGMLLNLSKKFRIYVVARILSFFLLPVLFMAWVISPFSENAANRLYLYRIMITAFFLPLILAYSYFEIQIRKQQNGKV